MRVETKQRFLEGRRKLKANEKSFRGEHDQEPGARSQEPGAGARSQEPGARSQELQDNGIVSVGIFLRRDFGAVSFDVIATTPILQYSILLAAPDSWLLAPGSTFGCAGRMRSGDFIGGRGLMFTFSVPLGQFLHHVKQHRNQENRDKCRRQHSADDRRSEDSP